MEASMPRRGLARRRIGAFYTDIIYPDRDNGYNVYGAQMRQD